MGDGKSSLSRCVPGGMCGNRSPPFFFQCIPLLPTRFRHFAAPKPQAMSVGANGMIFSKNFGIGAENI